MGEAHRNLLNVMKYAQRYYQINGHGFTAPELYRYMMDEVEISEPTVRVCLGLLEDENYIEETEVAQTAFFIPDEAMLPQPEKSDMFLEARQFW